MSYKISIFVPRRSYQDGLRMSPLRSETITRYGLEKFRQTRCRNIQKEIQVGKFGEFDVQNYAQRIQGKNSIESRIDTQPPTSSSNPDLMIDLYEIIGAPKKDSYWNCKLKSNDDVHFYCHQNILSCQSKFFDTAMCANTGNEIARKYRLIRERENIRFRI